MIKSRGTNGRVAVTFTLDPALEAQAATVAGEWDEWSGGPHAMHRDINGAFSLTMELEAGRSYRFRYVLDGVRWENDWSADAYVPNPFGGDDSVLDLTAPLDGVPAAGQPAPRRPAPAKAPATKKAVPAKKVTKGPTNKAV